MIISPVARGPVTPTIERPNYCKISPSLHVTMSRVYLQNSKHTNLALLLALKFRNLSGNFPMQQKLIQPVLNVCRVCVHSRIGCACVRQTRCINNSVSKTKNPFLLYIFSINNQLEMVFNFIITIAMATNSHAQFLPNRSSPFCPNENDTQVTQYYVFP